jgi:hypothetical protein
MRSGGSLAPPLKIGGINDGQPAAPEPSLKNQMEDGKRILSCRLIISSSATSIRQKSEETMRGQVLSSEVDCPSRRLYEDNREREECRFFADLDSSSPRLQSPSPSPTSQDVLVARPWGTDTHRRSFFASARAVPVCLPVAGCQSMIEPSENGFVQSSLF